MITLTFPEFAPSDKKELVTPFPQAVSGSEVLAHIAPHLLENTIAMYVNGTLCDLSYIIDQEASIVFLFKGDPNLLSLLRHDCAHILAEAVQALFPGTRVSIGPSIEEGFYYDFQYERPFTLEDLPSIEEKMRQIISANAPFVKEIWSRQQARDYFTAVQEQFKCELLDAIPESEPIIIYRQGNWLDLCRGPHMVSTGQIGGAFKLTKVSGAYWRGDARNTMLSRIYGTAFWSQEDLTVYLRQLEEAERRDHRRLGREMDLFHFEEEGPGAVFWHNRGWILYQKLIEYMRRHQRAADYTEVNTPQLLDRSLWEESGHWEAYQEHMFITATGDERIFALKPMNCPGHVKLFKNGLKSYRDLPLRLSEFGVVHRYEPSGALHGLMRVRAFTQDDAHIFCTEDQLFAESLRINNLILSVYKDFGFDKIQIKLATRPEKRVGDDLVWDKAELALKKVLDAMVQQGLPVALNPGDGAFYGPKLEYVLKDAIGRSWQCGTVQVDFNLPARLGAHYIDMSSQRVTPIMLHQVMFGSIERFIGVLIEHYGGRLPLWLAPLPVVICTITQEADAYAAEILEKINALGLKAEIDASNEKISYKIRHHSLAKIPLLFILGGREVAEHKISLRRFGSTQQESLELEEALSFLQRETSPPDHK